MHSLYQLCSSLLTTLCLITYFSFSSLSLSLKHTHSTLADQFGYLRHREKDLDKPVDSYKYFSEAYLYFQKAKEHVRKHASKSFAVLDMVRLL